MEADDDGLYVVKFRGAGQGPQALVAEVIAGELAARARAARARARRGGGRPGARGRGARPGGAGSHRRPAGDNLGVDFLPGALPYTPGAGLVPDPGLAAAVVWFDALVTNVDRTPRNPNLLPGTAGCG